MITRARLHERDFLEDVRGNHHDLAFREVLHQLPDLVLLIQVEAVGGLVEQEQLGIVEDRLGQRDAALEALGQGFDDAPALIPQLHAVHGAVDAPTFSRPL